MRAKAASNSDADVSAQELLHHEDVKVTKRVYHPEIEQHFTVLPADLHSLLAQQRPIGQPCEGRECSQASKATAANKPRSFGSGTHTALLTCCEHRIQEQSSFPPPNIGQTSMA